MIDTNPNEQAERMSPKLGPVTKVNLGSFFTEMWNKIPSSIKNLLNKFYSNKKIFLPVAISVGLIFFVILLGLVFGTKAPTSAPKSTLKPTPVSATTPTATPQAVDSLTQIELQLGQLKDKITSLDVGQSRLQPPQINYEVKF